jgi:hypothetical protein
MTKILAFSGRKQSGKSTSGEFVEKFIKQNFLPISCKLYSFADPLKQDICMNLLGLTHEQCYGTDEDKNTLTNIRWSDMPIEIQQKHYNDMVTNDYLTGRQVMEVIGTEIFRKMYGNIWVDATISKIYREQHDLAIILDNRFPNEVNSVLDNNGIVIRLTKDIFNSDSEPERALDPDNYDWTRFSLVLDNSNMTLEQKNNTILTFLQNQGILPL